MINSDQTQALLQAKIYNVFLVRKKYFINNFLCIIVDDIFLHMYDYTN